MSASDGKRKRDEALDLLKAHRRELIAGCRAAMVALYAERLDGGWGEEPHVDGDDACEWLDAAGCGHDYRLIGAVFHPKSGWRYVRTVNSRLARRHHREIKGWAWEGQKG